MSDRYGSGDDLVLPFLFVPHGEPESPEVAAFKSRYPDWFSIPADFVAHDDPEQPDDAFASPDEQERSEAPRPKGIEQDDTSSALRAFQRANALHGDPVAALRALRDAPDAFADDALGEQVVDQSGKEPGTKVPTGSAFPLPLREGLGEGSRCMDRSVVGAVDI
ncbi:MAG: hypothetical protein ABI224_01025 [Acetobacteraceae bacterium]